MNNADEQVCFEKKNIFKYFSVTLIIAEHRSKLQF